MTREELLSRDPVLSRVAQGEEVLWRNPRLCPFDGVESTLPLHRGDILAAEARLHRFAPLIRAAFPETADQGGLIESPLRPIPGMQAALERRWGTALPGKLLLKQDSHLAIAGSVKAGHFSLNTPSRWGPPATWG